jgi:hypothetical protein
MNYLVTHRASNLITQLVASSFPLKPKDGYVYIEASEQMLDKYYRLKVKSRTEALGIGNLMKLSPSFQDAYHKKVAR